jgi:geranylgeranyl transferase type-2 subunit alpha
MHGRKRAEYKERLRDPKTAAGLAQKAEKWYALVKELSRRRESDSDQAELSTTITLIEKALLVNPDPINLWNHRRELILLETKGKEETDSILQNELALTQATLQRNPKAYGAWFHRKWILALLKPKKEVLDNELKMTANLFAMDERNFHCWNYRRFVVSAMADCWNGAWELPEMGPQIGAMVLNTASATIPSDVIQSEWEFTHQKIQDNFSNFSAFHYRSQLLPHILAQTEDGNKKKDLLEEELQLVENAIFTEPDDQTAWWYHKLLLLEHKFEPSRLEDQAEMLRELLEDSPGKWVLLGLHGVLSISNTCQEEQGQLLKRLIEVDSDRANRYEYLLLNLNTNESNC